MKIPYQLVSMAAMLRDYIDPEEMVYLDREHEKFTDIADSLYAAVVTPDQFTDEYKKLYDEMGADYFDKVLDDMQAIDSQLTSDEKVDELWYDYEDRLNSGVTASSKVKASGNPFYDKLSAQGKRFVKNTEKRMAADDDVTVDNICTLAYMTLPAEDIDHHATDLYIRKTPESTKLINRLDNKALLSTFIDNIDHVTWYELPFCYDSRVAAKFENR